VAGSPGAGRKPDPKGAPGHEIEVLEKNTDTSWAMFQALHTEHERRFEKTEPASLLHVQQLQAGAGRPPALTVDDVLQEARRNNRVCPKPAVWQRLYEWLPNKGEQLAAAPTTRTEWERLAPLEKRSRLREHIEWAAVQGVLQKVHEALQRLPEDRWHHMGE
jgi:hypothetical protein